MTINLILHLKEFSGQDGLNLNTDDSAEDKDRIASKSLWFLQSNVSKTFTVNQIKWSYIPFLVVRGS